MPYDTEYRLDEVDRRILHALMENARQTTAAAIAETVNVSGATVRNRIQKLEDHDIIRGYSARIDFERAGGKLTNLYLCDVPVEEREALAHEASAIPGVINVRSLMTGRRNLHVLAVGETTRDLRRVSRRLSELGIHIEDEDLLEDELDSPYGPFSPAETRHTPEPNDFISLTGDANVVELTVGADASIAGLTLEEAGEQDILDADTLIIAIERDDQELTPRGQTVVCPDDIVTILSRHGTDTETLDAFQGRQREHSP